jgi:hypothetical protein
MQKWESSGVTKVGAMFSRQLRVRMDRASLWEPSVSPPRGRRPPLYLRGGGLVYGRRRDRSGPTGLGMGVKLMSVKHQR